MDIKINSKINPCVENTEILNQASIKDVTYSETLHLDNKQFLFSKLLKENGVEQDFSILINPEIKENGLDISLKVAIDFKKAKYNKQVFFKEFKTKLEKQQTIVITKCLNPESGARIYLTY